jgi:Ca2+-binding RTX toxin-like protein
VFHKDDIFDIFDGGTGTDTLRFLDNRNVTLNGFDAAASEIKILHGNGRALNGTREMDVFDLSGLTKMTNLRFIDAKLGDDILIGSKFRDVLVGGEGDDILDGRGGNDLLFGDAGRNTYVFGDGYGSDVVRTYNAGQDKFDLRGVSGVSSFAELNLVQITPNSVRIDFGSDTLTIDKATVAVLTANQADFLFS